MFQLLVVSIPHNVKKIIGGLLFICLHFCLKRLLIIKEHTCYHICSRRVSILCWVVLWILNYYYQSMTLTIYGIYLLSILRKLVLCRCMSGQFLQSVELISQGIIYGFVHLMVLMDLSNFYSLSKCIVLTWFSTWLIRVSECHSLRSYSLNHCVGKF